MTTPMGDSMSLFCSIGSGFIDVVPSGPVNIEVGVLGSDVSEEGLLNEVVQEVGQLIEVLSF